MKEPQRINSIKVMYGIKKNVQTGKDEQEFFTIRKNVISK